jgi:transcriptional regulator with XRE-family HTH domain
MLTVEDNVLTATERSRRVEQVTGAVADRVRSLRTGRGWSLDELAGRSGVSKGMLVQIEAARTNPSLGTLCRVADAFGVSMTLLLEPAADRVVHVAEVDAAPELWHGDQGGWARLLGGVGSASVAELWHWQMAPGEVHRSPDHAPGTREIVHVLEGTLTVTIDATAYDVEAGRTIEFVSDRPHGFGNRGSRLCRFEMLVAMPAGEHDRRGHG